MSDSPLLCCGSIKPYRPMYLLHQSKFTNFMAWATYPKACPAASGEADKVDLDELKPPFVIQLVRQVNYGPMESKRFFASLGHQEGKGQEFVEVSENDLIQANFQKLNSYKNFKCDSHNKFFEVNIYQKDPVNQHHWRVNIARPGSEIDLK
ncbi:hypothetical protein RB595_010163 [Gaeumannomyces hyphopodioides]